ncbi:hypothetical protein GGTG_03995 [Gaeumannomyces tritici R3-111a-1]|uniref:Aminoglycoside phosphotransferase domain-containing protein n=1 Tax=Gaeumannomyces tritici (strain R3-111a-1) TaxID=644352 RepID=J3NRU6_GAET3|nr:hypothetical protein GGTG_03995 [Gaeumannomyces tritici R3-111a-1]EJT78902.1 hypothetical protein GGTG_03995 [Gaeumannomyces tritici R3-111a-1]
MTPPVAGRRDDGFERMHEGSEALAINDTPLRRFATLAAYRLTKLLRSRLSRGSGTCTYLLGGKLVVKTGASVHLQEAATMRWVAENTTSVPVPKVHCAFVHKNRAYIVMERVRGSIMGKALQQPPISDDEQARKRLLQHLRSIVQELRSIPPPPGMVGVQSCTGGSLHDCRIPRDYPRFGPFNSIREFHFWLRDGFDLANYPHRDAADADDEDGMWRGLKDMVALQDGPWPAPVFTHGDLHAGNILVDRDRVSAIIDWEGAGWYPCYWEYTQAWTLALMNDVWQDLLPEFMEPYPEALKMEQTRQRSWGEY